MKSESFELARKFLNKKVKVTIDRPIGSNHPKWGFEYSVNYGFVEGVLAPDGEGLDVYILNISEPVEYFEGEVVAVLHRLDDDDDKLIVVPVGESVTDDMIDSKTDFQEKFFKHEIIRA